MDIDLYVSLTLPDKRKADFLHFMLSAGGDVPLFEEEVELEDRPIFNALEMLLLPQTLSPVSDSHSVELSWFLPSFEEVEEILVILKELNPKSMSGLFQEVDCIFRFQLRKSELKIKRGNKIVRVL